MIGIEAFWKKIEGNENLPTHVLDIRLKADVSMVSVAESWAIDLEKLSKRKNWYVISERLLLF